MKMKHKLYYPNTYGPKLDLYGDYVTFADTLGFGSRPKKYTIGNDGKPIIDNP